MKFNPLVAGVLGATAVAASKAFDSAKMEGMMELKTQEWEAAAARGMFAGSKKYKKTDKLTKCKNGYAGEYKCNNVDMYSFLSHEDMGSESFTGNDVWGWASEDGREFGIVGQTDGVAFVEINKKGQLIYLGRLDTYTTVVSWRDIKVIKHHAYIGSEAEGHGMQIFDLHKLLDIDPASPVVFDNAVDLTAHYGGFGASHNLVAHPEVDMIYAVGGRTGPNNRNTTCAGGMWMVDVSDPSNPTSPGCVGEAGYVHDAQCVIYTGPTTEFTGKEICFGYNEDTLTIYDMTDKAAVEVISETPYVGNEYTHQGWLIDSSMTFLLLDDELDERDGAGPPAGELGGLVNHTTTYIFDVSNLFAPVNTGFYQAPVMSIDHNQYTLRGLSYQANYGSGLRVLDVSGVSVDPTGGNIEETGFFDCHPEDDAIGGEVAFLGTWSVYPWFESGFILLNSIERGVYSLKYTGREAAFGGEEEEGAWTDGGWADN
jgi:choice-of-anchor B domain-containing protein